MEPQSTDTQKIPYPVCDDISQVPSLLKEYGVCVIPNVFSNNECDSWMRKILSNIEAISGNEVDHTQPETWTVDKLPPQIRYGLYQNLVSNLQPVWEIRRDERLKSLFKQVYSTLRGESVEEFVCSIDGINIQPNISRNTEGEKDWPHFDQTERDDIFKCVQSQVVLTNTTAAFRASPTSHKYFTDMLELAGIPDNGFNFAKFTDDQIEELKASIISPNKVPFQVPIKAEKGSVILWLSSTMHSAMSARSKANPTPEDPFKGWRGVVYVCYRPKSDLTADQLKILDDCLENNRGTSHWSTRVFSHPSIQKRNNKQFYLNSNGIEQEISPIIKQFCDDPKLVYDVTKYQPSKGSNLIYEQ